MAVGKARRQGHDGARWPKMVGFDGRDEILDDIGRFTDLKILLTACWVDRPYSHGGQ